MTTPASATPVAATDRVSDVLARDESLVDVFVKHGRHFAKLRNRAMRRVMARLVTVDQAARTAGVPVSELVRDLNLALGIRADASVPDVDARAAAPAIGAGAADASGTAAPAPESHPAHASVVELDVRDDLRLGREPFSRIMAAVAALGEREVLRLRAIFEPAPLFTVLGKRGLAHESVAHAPDDWSVWFWRPGAFGAASGASAAALDAAAPGAPATADAEPVAPSPGDEPSTSADARTVWLDVRGLEPPEPLLRTLAALETLPEGHELVQVNARVPQLLFPMLAERGFACDVDESHADRVLVRIWRPA